MIEDAVNPRVFFTSIPKCGKNLLYSMFASLGFVRHKQETDVYAQDAYTCLLKGINYVYADADCKYGRFSLFAHELGRMQPNSIFHRHLLPLPEFFRALAHARIKPILVIRDPRDALLSAAHYANHHGKPDHFVGLLPSRRLKDIVRVLLSGEQGTVGFADHFDAYLPWLQEPNTLVVRFEDLIGERGGGSRPRQLEVVAQTLGHVGLPADPGRVAQAADRVFNPRAGTFFRGKIGEWARLNDAVLDDLFMRHAGHLLGRWGYG